MKDSVKEIYFAGGCFWGVEAYFKRISGVQITETGYANGKTAKTTYHELAKTEHAKTVRIIYDPATVYILHLSFIYCKKTDSIPCPKKKQGS